MKRFYNWRWWTVALRGIAAIVLGVIALGAPKLAFLSLVVVFGAFALLDGVLAMGLASRVPRSMRNAMIGRGLTSLVTGVIALAWPGITAFVLLFMIAAWAIVSGILEIVTAIQLRKEIRGEGLLILEGVLSIGFGLVLFLSPLAGAVVLGIWVGAYALVLGGMMLSSAWRLRKAQQEGMEGLEPMPAAA
jgi:uncharacterized membrane protein HdeD (DUF308 family)